MNEVTLRIKKTRIVPSFPTIPKGEYLIKKDKYNNIFVTKKDGTVIKAKEKIIVCRALSIDNFLPWHTICVKDSDEKTDDWRTIAHRIMKYFGK